MNQCKHCQSTLYREVESQIYDYGPTLIFRIMDCEYGPSHIFRIMVYDYGSSLIFRIMVYDYSDPSLKFMPKTMVQDYGQRLRPRPAFKTMIQIQCTLLQSNPSV